MKLSKKKIIYSLFLIIMGLTVVNEVVTAIQKPKTVDRGYENMFKGQPNGVVVLNYHRVIKSSPINNFLTNMSNNEQLHEFNTNSHDFDQQMQFLKQHHVQVISYAKMLKLKAAGPIHGRYAVITFDDVDRTMPENAYKILKKNHLPFTVFIVTGLVNKKVDGLRMADWQQLTAMSKDPLVTIGVHTNDMHYQIHNTPALQSKTISEKAKEKDYRLSQKTMVNHFGHPAKYFTYPYGAVNEQLNRYMGKHGIESSSNLDPGMVNQGTDNMQIPRMLVNPQSWSNFEKWFVK